MMMLKYIQSLGAKWIWIKAGTLILFIMYAGKIFEVSESVSVVDLEENYGSVAFEKETEAQDCRVLEGLAYYWIRWVALGVAVLRCLPSGLLTSSGRCRKSVF